VPSFVALEAGVSGFFTCFHATEKRLKSTVYIFNSNLQNVAMYRL
jgi:hypothetical protein